jgi:protein-tyrosine-phosphatase
MKKVLFVCTHNSGRSQMAEAYFNKLAGGTATATSAGITPAKKLNPVVAKVMEEAGLDISNQRPKLLTEEISQEANRIITMGCDVAEGCPISLVSAENWNIQDPEGQSITTVRQIRDEVERKVSSLIGEI